MSAERERRARMALACVLEPGRHRCSGQVLEEGAEAVWAQALAGQVKGLRASPAELDVDAVMTQTQRAGARFVIPGDDEWPEPLDDLRQIQAVGETASDTPLGLWVTGAPDLAAMGSGSVAIVGSRASTAYGETVASDLAAGLADLGLPVVSGAAYGIDAAAHRGSLSADGITVAVLACGVDRDYPAGNAALLRQIRRTGLVVSEHPPGATVNRTRFLARNRIIAALTSGTVLVEFALRSGARNTMSWAGDLSRKVLAVPGPVTSAMSDGPNSAIRDRGASLVTSAHDVVLALTDAAVPDPVHQSEPATRFDQLTADQQRVREALPSRGGITVGEVSALTGLVVPLCLMRLAELEQQGFAWAEAGLWRAQRVV